MKVVNALNSKAMNTEVIKAVLVIGIMNALVIMMSRLVPVSVVMVLVVTKNK